MKLLDNALLEGSRISTEMDNLIAAGLLSITLNENEAVIALQRSQKNVKGGLNALVVPDKGMNLGDETGGLEVLNKVVRDIRQELYRVRTEQERIKEVVAEGIRAEKRKIGAIPPSSEGESGMGEEAIRGVEDSKGDETSEFTQRSLKDLRAKVERESATSSELPILVPLDPDNEIEDLIYSADELLEKLERDTVADAAVTSEGTDLPGQESRGRGRSAYPQQYQEQYPRLNEGAKGEGEADIRRAAREEEARVKEESEVKEKAERVGREVGGALALLSGSLLGPPKPTASAHGKTRGSERMADGKEKDGGTVPSGPRKSRYGISAVTMLGSAATVTLVRSKLGEFEGIFPVEDEGRKGPSPFHATPDGGGEPSMKVPAFREGGRVERTGLAYVHEGEMVIPEEHAAKIVRGEGEGTGRERTVGPVPERAGEDGGRASERTVRPVTLAALTGAAALPAIPMLQGAVPVPGKETVPRISPIAVSDGPPDPTPKAPGGTREAANITAPEDPGSPLTAPSAATGMKEKLHGVPEERTGKVEGEALPIIDPAGRRVSGSPVERAGAPGVPARKSGGIGPGGPSAREVKAREREKEEEVVKAPETPGKIPDLSPKRVPAGAASAAALSLLGTAALAVFPRTSSGGRIEPSLDASYHPGTAPAAAPSSTFETETAAAAAPRVPPATDTAVHPAPSVPPSPSEIISSHPSSPPGVDTKEGIGPTTRRGGEHISTFGRTPPLPLTALAAVPALNVIRDSEMDNLLWEKRGSGPGVSAETDLEGTGAWGETTKIPSVPSHETSGTGREGVRRTTSVAPPPSPLSSHEGSGGGSGRGEKRSYEREKRSPADPATGPEKGPGKLPDTGYEPSATLSAIGVLTGALGSLGFAGSSAVAPSTVAPDLLEPARLGPTTREIGRGEVIGPGMVSGGMIPGAPTVAPGSGKPSVPDIAPEARSGDAPGRSVGKRGGGPEEGRTAVSRYHESDPLAVLNQATVLPWRMIPAPDETGGVGKAITGVRETGRSPDPGVRRVGGLAGLAGSVAVATSSAFGHITPRIPLLRGKVAGGRAKDIFYEFPDPGSKREGTARPPKIPSRTRPIGIGGAERPIFASPSPSTHDISALPPYPEDVESPPSNVVLQESLRVLRDLKAEHLLELDADERRREIDDSIEERAAVPGRSGKRPEIDKDEIYRIVEEMLRKEAERYGLVFK